MVFSLQMAMTMLMVILIILFFAIKGTKLYVLVVTLSAKDNQILSKLLSKDSKDQFIGMNIKQTVILKIQQVNIDIF